MNKKKYKVIFFDWNKTLSNSLFWEQLADVKHERHVWYENITRFLFVENTQIVRDWMHGKIDTHFVVDQIHNVFGYAKEHLVADLVYSCKNMKFVHEEILTKIHNIRQNGTKCVIATDNMDVFLSYTQPSLRLHDHFDDLLVSCELGVLKYECSAESIPFFDPYLLKNDLTYRDVLLIDDCAEKTGAYAQLGFDIMHIRTAKDLMKTVHALDIL